MSLQPNSMTYRLSRHAEWEAARRQLPLALIEGVLSSPGQRVADDAGTGNWVYQSQLRFEDGKIYLLRVVVAEEHIPPVVVTVYKTSKIEKYWSLP